MKKLLAILLSVLLIVSTFGVVSFATNENVAKVGNTEYATIDEAIAAWTNGTTLTLLADVTLSDVIMLSSTEHHILDLGTYTMTAASGKDAIQYVVNGRSSPSYALDIKADATNPGGITATGKAIVSHIKPKSNAPSKDRPMTRFYGGVFNATYVVRQGGSLGAGYTGASAPYFYFYDGVYNGTIYTNRSHNEFYGGTFNGNMQMSVDSSAWTKVAGGRFKNLSNSMRSDLDEKIAQGKDNYKFTIGTAKATYDKEVYIDDEGYIVVAADKPSQGIEAAVAMTPGGDDYYYYSKVATEGALNYTDMYMALEKNKTATITVYTDELDLANSSFTGTIVVPEGHTLTISNAPEGLKVEGEGEVVFVEPVAKIGDTQYSTLAEAFADAQDGDTITLLADIETADAITNTKSITLDLNGKTITGTDNSTASFGLITNKGTLTVTGDGTITLVATNDRDWNAYSSVISNTVGGKLIVESGTIEHLGGSDMAYGIDNLTNGKGTYAETVVNGGTVKSTYRAIRQFLNGVEAQNILTINGGTVEGANKSVWMQDPSAKANTGTLTVTKDATLIGDVYLYVTEGSTEWPVKVSIAAAALQGDSEVLTGNVPAGYAVENTNGTYGVTPVPTGSNSPAYTKEEGGYVRVWGEGGGNAKESFVLKLYSGEALMATTTLNNIGGIIDGEVYVTWNFYYPSSNDEYWTTVWEEGHPNSLAQPTEVELWIDGTCVATTPAKMSGADDINPVVWEELGGVKYIVTGLSGSGTEEDPYKIGSLDDLILFRDSVNAGETKYNAPGVYVALTADIDMAGATWERGIGDGITASFDGIFDGKNFTIKNLNFAPKADSDGYLCGGLFGYTYGAVTIKDLVLENIKVDASDAVRTGNKNNEPHNIGILVGFANNKGGKLTVSNVTVKNAVIDAPNVDGVGAIIGYSYRAMGTIENCTVDGATIKGYSFVGGITGYSNSDAVITGCSVKNATITATSKGAGGIAGIVLGGDKVTGNTVADTTVTAPTNWGYVVGEVASEGILIKDNTAANPQVGGSYSTGEKVQAHIDGKYYTTFAAAYAAAKDDETITLLAPITVNAGETLTLDKNITITYTSNVAGEDMITNYGTLIVDGTTLIYNNTDTTASNVTVSTISCGPGSVLEVKSGVVKNDSANNGSLGIYAYAIDLLTNGSLGDVTATISGGEVISTNYMAIRQFNNGTACKNTLTVTDGYIYGAKRAVQVHLDNNAAYTTISGGIIEAGEGGYALCLFPTDAENLSVTGGTFIGTVYSGTNGFISGGTFNEEVYSDYVTEGFEAVDNGDGTYGVEEKEIPQDPFKVFYIIDMIPETDANGNTNYRVGFGAGIDSLNYRAVGFDVVAENGASLELKTTQVYDLFYIYNTDGSLNMTVQPSMLGGNYIFYQELLFPAAYDNMVITFRPFYVTLSGEKISFNKSYDIADIYTSTVKEG